MPPTVIRRTAATVAVAVLAALTPTHTHAATPVTSTVTFNDSKGGTDPNGQHARDRIRLQQENAFDRAVPGSTVVMAVWAWQLGPTTDAAVRAVRRGVNVEVILNGGRSEHPEALRLKKLIGPRLHICRSGGCLGSTGTMHAKFLIASDVGDGRGTLVQVTSSNPMFGQLDSYNDLVEIRGSQTMYDNLHRITRDMRSGAGQSNYANGPGHFTADGFEVWVGSHAKRGPDPLARILAPLPVGPRCISRVMNSRIDSSRPKFHAQLQRLHKSGCGSRILTRVTDQTTVSNLAGIPRRRGEPHNHMKTLLVRDANGRHTIVFGSSNGTGDPFRNTEIIVRAVDPPFTGRYFWWNDVLWSRAG